MTAVQIYLGPGGVGKTTVAASAGIAAALAGRRAIVLTIDPARRLADTLGPSGAGLGNEPRLVDGPWPGELWAAMLDPAATLEALIRRHGGARQAERVIDNRLFSTIAHSLSGLNEYMAAERLHELHHDERYDDVVIDTPPSRHAVEFLDSPDRVRAFLGNPFYRRVLAPRRGLARSVNVATQLFVRLSAKMVGADLLDDVVRLFADLDGLDRGFHQRATETAALLAGPECSYSLVTAARREPMGEAAWIRDTLARRSKPIDRYVVNRVTPTFGLDPDEGSDETGPLGRNRDELSVLIDQERMLIAELTGSLHARRSAPDPSIVTLEERHRPLRTLDDLTALATDLTAT